MGGAVGEWVIGHKPVRNVVLSLADHSAQFEGKRRRNGNRARDILVVVYHFGRNAGGGKDAADDIAGVIAADTANDGIYDRWPAD